MNPAGRSRSGRTHSGGSPAVGADADVERILHLLDTVTVDLGPRTPFTDALRARVMDQFLAQRGPTVPARAPAGPSRLFRTAIAASLAAAMLVGATGAAAAAQESIPGDPLYALKRAIEQVELGLASAADRPALEREMLAERIDELREVTASDRWQSVRELSDEILALGQAIIAGGGTLEGIEADWLDALSDATQDAPPSEAGHLGNVLAAARDLTETGGGNDGGQPPGDPGPAETPAPDPSPTVGTGNSGGGNGNGNSGGGNSDGGNSGGGNSGGGNSGGGNGSGSGNGGGNGNSGGGNGNGDGNGGGNGNSGGGNGNSGGGNGNGNGNSGGGNGNSGGGNGNGNGGGNSGGGSGNGNGNSGGGNGNSGGGNRP